MNRKLNLIVCITPLHVLIASKIIDHQPNDRFFVLCINSNNGKFKHYNELISKKCERYFLFVPRLLRPISMFLGIYNLNKFINKNFKNYVFNNLIVSGLESSFIHNLIKKINYVDLNSYDDGFANLNVTGTYFVEKTTIKKQIINKVFLIDSNIKKIKNKISRHFSIYNDCPFIENTHTIKLNLFQPSDFRKNESVSSVKKIFLGQPINEFTDYNYTFVNRVLEYLEIDSYFPHPREKENINLNSVEVIESDFIFEDYLLKEVESKKDFEIIVYGFISTSLLILNDNNVKTFSVGNNKLLIDLKDTYQTLSDRGIQVINLPVF